MMAIDEETGQPPGWRLTRQRRVVGLFVLDLGQLGRRSELAPAHALVALVHQCCMRLPGRHQRALGGAALLVGAAGRAPGVKAQAPAAAKHAVMRVDECVELRPCRLRQRPGCETGHRR